MEKNEIQNKYLDNFIIKCLATIPLLIETTIKFPVNRVSWFWLISSQVHSPMNIDQLIWIPKPLLNTDVNHSAFKYLLKNYNHWIYFLFWHVATWFWYFSEPFPFDITAYFLIHSQTIHLFFVTQRSLFISLTLCLYYARAHQ